MTENPTHSNDTWHWLDGRGEVFHVVQKEDGSVVCNGAHSFTAAYAETWEIWKRDHGWKRMEDQK